MTDVNLDRSIDDVSSPPINWSRVAWCMGTPFAVWAAIVLLPWPYLFALAQSAGLAAGSPGLLAIVAAFAGLSCLICNSPRGSKEGSGFMVALIGILAIAMVVLAGGKLAAEDHVDGTSIQYFTGEPALMLPNVCAQTVEAFFDPSNGIRAMYRDIIVNGVSTTGNGIACDRLFNVVEVVEI